MGLQERTSALCKRNTGHCSVEVANKFRTRLCSKPVKPGACSTESQHKGRSFDSMRETTGSFE